MFLPFFINLGIGRAIAKKLVECGAETIALSRTQADLDSLKAEVNCSQLISQLVLSEKNITGHLKMFTLVRLEYLYLYVYFISKYISCFRHNLVQFSYTLIYNPVVFFHSKVHCFIHNLCLVHANVLAG